MKSKRSSPCSKQHTRWLYPKPDYSVYNITKYFRNISFNIIPLIQSCLRYRVGDRILWPAGQDLPSSHLCPGQLWDPHSLLHNGYGGGRKTGQRLRTHGAIPPRHIGLHGVELSRHSITIYFPQRVYLWISYHSQNKVDYIRNSLNQLIVVMETGYIPFDKFLASKVKQSMYSF
jgi:hypothetical protein